jgi:hypothetical protein
MRLARGLFLALVSVSLWPSAQARACSCSELEVDRAYDASDVVFEGSIVQSEQLMQSLALTFEVERSWKGVGDANEIDVHRTTPDADDTCSDHAPIGSTWIVFASRDDEEILRSGFGPCSYSVRVRDNDDRRANDVRDELDKIARGCTIAADDSPPAWLLPLVLVCFVRRTRSSGALEAGSTEQAARTLRVFRTLRLGFARRWVTVVGRPAARCLRPELGSRPGADLPRRGGGETPAWSVRDRPRSAPASRGR